MEDELGVQLFVDRRRRPLQLTLAGQTFLEQARLAVAQTEQAVRLTRLVHQGELGRLTVGFTSSIANSVLPDIVQVFRQRFPEVKLVWRELSTHSQIQELHDRQIDVGFFHVPRKIAEYEDLSFITILEEPLIAVLPETHPLATQAKISLKALAQEEFVLPSRQFVPGLSEGIYHLCDRANFVPNVTQEATLMTTILGLVAGGVGVALLPANAQNLQRKGVVYKSIKGKTLTVQMAAFWRHNNSSAILREFLKVTKTVTGYSH
ncbi:LysR substrate-binding domain-containing protein [Scytonema sp. UIC 10036]|uniref:LysR family transcriptional regulator n=1 Tax=Scytonema sp. UIC 10036 TaxID=2304196 RepID=UPI00325B34E1